MIYANVRSWNRKPVEFAPTSCFGPPVPFPGVPLLLWNNQRIMELCRPHWVLRMPSERLSP